MRKDILALLVFADSDSLPPLEGALQRQSVSTRRVKSCGEARQFIERQKSPDIIFTDIAIPDGTWADVVKMARKGKTSAEVIVVSRLPDTKLYMDVMERGGFDFVSPPFAQADLSHILESATTDATKRWGAAIRAAANVA